MHAKLRGADASTRRVLFDLSHTYNSPHQTGIQRVVRRLLRELPAACQAAGLEFQAVVIQDGRFVPLESVQPELRPRSWRQVSRVHEDVLALCPAWYRAAASGVCRLLPLKFLRKWLLPTQGHLGIFKLPLKVIKALGVAIDNNAEQKIDVSSSDLLILPDGYWVMMHVWPAIEAAHKAGARTAFVIYDALCISHSQFFVPHAKEIFSNYLRAVNEVGDVVITLTNTGKESLEELLPTLSPQATRWPNCTSFRLGAEFPTAGASVRPQLSEIKATTGSSTFLMVSTFEPRKNHLHVLNTFEKLWKTHPESKLVMVGAVGWLSEELLQRVRNHPLFQKQLFVYHDLNDAEVAHSYELCDAVIFSSFAEGFGLPIVEAQWHGKHVFVSDNPVHREVGEAECTYFSLEDTDSLLRALVRWEDHPQQRPVATKKLPVDWRYSAKDFLRQVQRSLTRDASTAKQREAA